MNKTFPIVSIVGRTNVGKSTLFNRLADNTRAIVFDREGVTRDFLADTITWNNVSFTLVDTGGITYDRHADSINKQVQGIARDCMQRSDVILFVIDGSVPLHPVDEQIAREIRKTGKPIVLLLNKIDKNVSSEYHDELINHFHFKHQISISASHGKGIAQLLEVILLLLPEKKEKQEVEALCKVTLLGKPNVGKSSLLNALLHQNRAIVSDVPGTTREALIERVRFHQDEIQIADTAGVRRKRSIHDTLEQSMVSSTMFSVKHADIVLLMVDAHEGALSDQEIKLAYYAFDEQKKALIILWNKQDLVTDETKQQLEYDKEMHETLLNKVATLSISCTSGKNLGRVLPLVKTVWQRYSQWFDQEELFAVLMAAMEKKTLHKSENRLILYKLKQINTAPITILLTVNEPKWFDDSHTRFFENIIRKHFQLQGVPLVFGYRKKNQ